MEMGEEKFLYQMVRQLYPMSLVVLSIRIDRPSLHPRRNGGMAVVVDWVWIEIKRTKR